MKIRTYIDDYEKLYLQPKNLTEIFSVSRSTVSRLLQGMRQSSFADGYIRVSPTLTLINIKQFQAYLRSLDGGYLQRAK